MHKAPTHVIWKNLLMYILKNKARATNIFFFLWAESIQQAAKSFIATSVSKHVSSSSITLFLIPTGSSLRLHLSNQNYSNNKRKRNDSPFLSFGRGDGKRKENPKFRLVLLLPYSIDPNVTKEVKIKSSKWGEGLLLHSLLPSVHCLVSFLIFLSFLSYILLFN